MPSDRYLDLCQFAPYMNYYGKQAYKVVLFY